MSWQGRILVVDLTTHRSHVEPLNQSYAEEYLGLRGLATRYLMDLIDPAVDPLSADNVLIIATGPLTGTMASTGGRWGAITKGALTNAIACSNSGGKFGAELKSAGYDLLILKGRSETPVYLHIADDEVQILPAEPIWGQSVWAADEWIHRQHQDDNLRIAAIGVSGERGARYACIVNDLHRAAGRSGVGAVMGSKQLKAIAVRGTRGVSVRHPQLFMTATNEAKEKLANNRGRQSMTKNGTHAMLSSMQAFGGLPTYNFRQVQFDQADSIDHRAARRANPNGHTNYITNKACFACTIACGRIAHIDPTHFSVADRPQYHGASGGLEYESAFALGPVVGVSDIDALTFANMLTNEHGLDPISFGVTLAAAMELHAEGLLPAEKTDGIALEFGSAQALCVMAEKTGKQEGFGVELGLGAKLLTERYGRPELFMGVKGQEFAGYDARALPGMGLGYATSNRGACHLRHDVFSEDMADQGPEGKAQPCKDTQDNIAAIDATGLCMFASGPWDLSDYAAQVAAACGEGWDVQRLRTTGERIWNLERQFNIAAGLGRADDSLPPRMLNEPVPSGTAEGRVNELEVMLDEYYRLRGWDAQGQPLAETLQRLGL